MRWRSRLGERRRKDWHQIQLADKSPRLFFNLFFFFKTQPKRVGTTSFQSCKKVVARGRAAGLWINMSIKEASLAPDFRACWTIFGCKKLPHNLVLSPSLCHRTSSWQHVFATAPLLWQQTLRSREKALPQKWVVAFFATASPMWHNLLLEARRVATLFCHRSCRWQLGFRGG